MYRRTPALSPSGMREILEEMAHPPRDTPERRGTEERVRFMEEVRRRSGTDDRLPPLVSPPVQGDTRTKGVK